MIYRENIIFPEKILETENDLFGMKHQFDELWKSVILPLKCPKQTLFIRAPLGVLLYGPPGTGKTLLAKVLPLLNPSNVPLFQILAKKGGCTFLAVDAATLLSAWQGESEQKTRALFTLAKKIQPCIIFIGRSTVIIVIECSSDEVDALLSNRGNQDRNSMINVKNLLLAGWQGIRTTSSQRVVLIGATNRRSVLDPAVLRRFSHHMEVQIEDVFRHFAIF